MGFMLVSVCVFMCPYAVVMTFDKTQTDAYDAAPLFVFYGFPLLASWFVVLGVRFVV